MIGEPWGRQASFLTTGGTVTTERSHDLPRNGMVGVVLAQDVDAFVRPSPLSLQAAVARAQEPDAVSATGQLLIPMVRALAEDGVDASEMGRIVSNLIDVMTRRLIELSIDRQGPPPADWAWLALGSGARMEQCIGTDQDHALAFEGSAGPLEELDSYFLRLARAVTEGLAKAGIPRCRADVVAENRALRRPLDHWVSAFRTWMGDPRVEAIRQTTILFDYRRIAGPLKAELVLNSAIASSPDRAVFARRLVSAAQKPRPPRGVWARHRPAVKKLAIMPVVGLARALAVDGGISTPETVGRLRQAAEMGLIDEGTYLRLVEALRIASTASLWLRLATQAKPGTTAHPDTRMPAEIRRGLREAFSEIRRAQKAIALDFEGSRPRPY